MVFSWYTSAVMSIFLWGVADVFYKKGTSPRDKHSHLRIVVMVGAVMGLQALFELHKLNWQFDLYNIIRYLPVSSMYILSMTLGYIAYAIWRSRLTRRSAIHQERLGFWPSSSLEKR